MRRYTLYHQAFNFPFQTAKSLSFLINSPTYCLTSLTVKLLSGVLKQRRKTNWIEFISTEIICIHIVMKMIVPVIVFKVTMITQFDKDVMITY